MKYYDWNKTLSYNADVTIVVGARGIGKTYGLRKHCIKYYIKKGYKYVEVVRYKIQISSFIKNYFGRLSTDDSFKKYEFKTEGDTGYIRLKDDTLKKEENPWQPFMYVVALTDSQKLKTRTFDHVKYIIFDEFILDKKMKQFYKYLPCEVAVLQDIVDTISRETIETKEADKVKVILMGNALDALNPYFVKFNLYKDLKKGKYRRFNNKRGLLHYVEVPDDYKVTKQNSVAFVFDDKQTSEVAANNEFYAMQNTSFIAEKTERAKCMCNIRDSNGVISLWCDVVENKLYCVSKEVPNVPSIALTHEVADSNNIIARRTNKIIKLMIDMFYVNCLYYDDKSTQLKVFQILNRYANI